jgi:AbrB family looped-hinge helix DNA binding protein
MSIATVTSKGQISIPARIRKHLGIEKGTQLFVEERGDEIVLRPLTAEHLDRMAGILRGTAKLSEMLLQDRAADRAREDG